ncbi:WG repeat-containing protein [Mangrovibacterium lignilyticum]|uniref:WG repeat-containing protein n=1 Tax=Mangrovibacterium lignilyticum TaxID=2668052 RepID=UPI0013D1EE3D|nr:WG repeat-containing protein [Mangrovibacterium lignilyticum]
MNIIGCYVEIVKEETRLNRFNLYKKAKWPNEEIRRKASEDEWDFYGFKPVKGNIGEAVGIVENDLFEENIYIILILEMFYVPISEKNLKLISEVDYLRRKKEEVTFVKASEGYITQDKDLLFSVVAKNGLFGFKDNLGNLITEYRYELAAPFKEGRALIRDSNYMGYINYEGCEIISPIFEDANTFHEKRAIVKTSKYFSINNIGEATSAKYDYMQDYNDGLSAVSLSRKWGFVDLDGNLKIPLVYDWVFNFHHKIAIVQKESKYGAINIHGHEILPCKYDFIGGTSQDGCFAAKKGKFWMLVSPNGAELTDILYESLFAYSNNLFAAQKDGKYGFVNSINETIIPFIYNKANVFIDGIAMVKKDNKTGYIDPNNNIVIPFDYEEGEQQSCGLFCVKKKNRWGCIDRSGKIIIPFKLDESCYFIHDLAEISINGEFWLVNNRGSFIRQL